MNLGDGIRDRLVVPDIWEKQRVWRCSKCGAYVVYAQGKYCFSCTCHDDKLKKSELSTQNTNPVLI